MLFAPVHVFTEGGLQIEFRPAQISDSAALLDTFYQIATESTYILSTPGSVRKKSIEDESKWIQDNNDHPKCILILATHQNQIIGICSFAAWKDPRREHRGSFGISILKKYQNQGIGQALLRFMIEQVRTMPGVKSIELSVMSPNLGAIHVYERFGFVQTGHTPKAFCLKDGSYADDLSMQLWIDEPT